MHIPADPASRSLSLADLQRYEVLDFEGEVVFDHITALACTICEAPIAAVSFFIADNQWFKSLRGLPKVGPIAREVSLCTGTLLGKELLEIPDTEKDARTRDNPYVTGGVRFYAGIPLISAEGQAFGTVCVMDSRTRTLTQAQRDALAQLRDMTMALLVARKTAHEAAQYWSILDQTSSEIYIWRASDGQFVHANLSALHNLQYSLDELRSLTPVDIGSTYSQQQIDDLVGSLRADPGGTRVLESVRRRKDGSTYPVEVRVQLLNRQSAQVCVSIANDITERRQVEQLKADFISTVSHELRTPLTSVVASLSLINGGWAGEVPEQAQTLIRIAHDNSERLVRLINDILDIQKMEAGQLEMLWAEIDLLTSIRKAIEANHAYAQTRQVSLALAPDAATGLVRVDADRLIQVMTNLLSNAIKFSPAGSLVRVTVQFEAGHLRVSVADQGPGIPEAFQSRVFQKFAQADTGDTRSVGGSGLGLHICKIIMEQMGGLIGFKTAPGAGSTFYFELPVYQQTVSPAANQPGDSATGPLRQKHLLVCEEDARVAHKIEHLLAGQGYQVDIAASVAHAEQLLARAAFDALILDVQFSEAGGLAFLEKLRRQYSPVALPVVVICASLPEGAEEINAGMLNVIGCLPKPFEPDHFIQMVRACIAGRRPRKAQILHVEDDESVAKVIASLMDGHAEIHPARSLAAAQNLLNEQLFDLVILDLSLPDGSGLALVEPLEAQQVPVLIFSASEVGQEISRQVAANLVKSRTSIEKLHDVIARLISSEPQSSGYQYE